jgi:hypothetical protein
MPRRTLHQPPSKPLKPRKSSNDDRVSLVSFVIHSFNRLRGKPDNEYQNALYKKQHPETRNPWRAVAIVPNFYGCKASKSIRDKRFLCDEAPALPLPGCTAETCDCRYKHFEDRRSGPRRADEQGVHVHMAGNLPSERRANRGRRRTDR